MEESQAIVSRPSTTGDLRPGADGATGEALRSRPRWIFRRIEAQAPPVPLGSFGRVLRQVCSEGDSSASATRLAQIATAVKGAFDGDTLSIGVTAAPGRGNRQSFTAVSLAGLWARWDYPTVLVEIGGSTCETGRRLRRTVPNIADVLTAIECSQHLPTPQPMSHSVANLDALAGLGRFSLARMADSGLLRELHEALSERYQRLIWSLPCVGPHWSLAMIAGVVDRLVLSVARGRTTRAVVERLASEAADVGLHPVQVVWHE